MADLITGDFNYGSVDSETASQLEYFAKSGKSLLRKSQVQFIADFGKILSEARDVLASHDKNKGKFIKWAVAEFDISERTIWNYVRAWDNILCNGCTTYLNWSPTALYLASEDEFPKSVQKKLEKIPSTELVRACDVKRLIAASKPKPEPEPEEPDFEESDPVDDEDEEGQEWHEEPASEAYQESDAIPFDAPEDLEQPTKSQASIVLDSIGRQIPSEFRPANELGITLSSIGRELDKYRQKAKELAEQPGGEWMRVQTIDECVRVLKGHFQECRYHSVCPKCRGKGCMKCKNIGWFPEYLSGTIN